MLGSGGLSSLGGPTKYASNAMTTISPVPNNKIAPRAFWPERMPRFSHQFFVFRPIGFWIDYFPGNRRLGDAVAQHQHQMDPDEDKHQRRHDENMDGEKAA